MPDAKQRLWNFLTEGIRKLVRLEVKYQACLTDPSTFDAWTLEAFIAALEAESHDGWTAELRTRYLG